MPTPLTKRQKSVLAQMATKAYKALVAVGCTDDSLTDWRREQQLLVTGVDSMTKMHQRHYVPLLNHYHTLAGARKKEDNTYSDTDKAIHRLRDIMARHEFPTDDLWHIVKCQFASRTKGYTIDDMWDVIKTKLTPEEIIRLSYTANNRGRSKTANINDDHDLDAATYEPYADARDMPPGNLSDHFDAELI